MARFLLAAPYAPAGDQPQAIDALARGLGEGQRWGVKAISSSWASALDKLYL